MLAGEAFRLENYAALGLIDLDEPVPVHLVDAAHALQSAGYDSRAVSTEVSAERSSQVKTPAPLYTPADTFPVSVKGVAVQAGQVLLLQNERNEWELPGGKLERGENPPDCVVREISEETGWQVTPGPLLDCWQYHIRPGSDVVIVTYGCHVLTTKPPVVSHEHKQAALFTPEEVPGLTMPDGYKQSIATWFAHLNARSR